MFSSLTRGWSGSGIHCDLSEPFTDRMQHLRQFVATQSVERINIVSQRQVKVEDVSGKSNVADGTVKKPHQRSSQLPNSKVQGTEVNLSSAKECGIKTWNISDMPKNGDTNYTSNITTPSKQKDGTLKATLS